MTNDSGRGFITDFRSLLDGNDKITDAGQIEKLTEFCSEAYFSTEDPGDLIYHFGRNCYDLFPYRKMEESIDDDLDVALAHKERHAVELGLEAQYLEALSLFIGLVSDVLVKKDEPLSTDQRQNFIKSLGYVMKFNTNAL